MDASPAIAWTVMALLAALFSVGLLTGRTKRSQERRVFTFWQRVGLPMGTEQINASVQRRLRRSATATLLGALAGLLAAAVALLLLPNSASTFDYLWPVVLPAVLVCATLLDVVQTLRDSLFVQRPDAPRMARTVAVTAADYVSPWRLRLAPLLVLLAAALAAAGLILGVAGEVDMGHFLRNLAIPSLLASALVLCGTVFAARRILAQPQPVSDPLELAWDDALRAETFRKMGLLAAAVAWFALAAGAMGFLGAFAHPGGTGGSVPGSALTELVFTWGYLAILAVFTFGGASNYFRYRLWRNLTPALPPSPGMTSHAVG